MYIPLAGMAGGLPGFCTNLQLRRAGQSKTEPLPVCHENIVLNGGDTVTVDIASGGGWGDPFDRGPDAVADEVQRGLLTLEEARDCFGVVPGHSAETERLRLKLRRQRLDRATPAPKPVAWTDELRRLAEGPVGPLGSAVEQRGAVAVAKRSGAPLSVSPVFWTEGCPRIHRFISCADNVDVVAYLDPETGDLLTVDVVPIGTERSFESSPHRWIAAAEIARQGAVAE